MIIQTLQKPPEKRNERDLQGLNPLLSELKFFKERKPLKHDDLMEVCKQMQYEFMEPREIVFRAGDHGDKFYIILKGKCQVQIPDPYRINKNELKEEVSEKEEEVVDDGIDSNRSLNPKELNALSPVEQRRYQTKKMLTDILNS